MKEATLGFSIDKESYAGSIKEISIGKGEKAVTVGGETSYPFYFFRQIKWAKMSRFNNCINFQPLSDDGENKKKTKNLKAGI